MIRPSLSTQLVLVYSSLLLASAAAFAWLQIRSSSFEEQQLIQLLSADVAEHIAAEVPLVDNGELTTETTRQLFDQLMSVNPSVEVYVLDPAGKIVGHAAPPGHVKREIVDIAPIREWLDGKSAPIFGDDPRSMNGRKVFSAATLEQDGRVLGYIYVILLSEARDLLARDVAGDRASRTTLAWVALAAVLGILVGTIALRRITQPLRALTKSMRELDIDELALRQQRQPLQAEQNRESDEIGILQKTFDRMGTRIADQWRALRRQDEQRREFVANVSHDLRTPLTALQGYLETLDVKGAELDDAERRRYLSAARALSEELGSLTRELLDLARLEHDAARLEMEPFSIVDLVQDVFEKLFLRAEATGHALNAEIDEHVPNVIGSVPMMERVLTNLLENAIRHTPAGTDVLVRITRTAESVRVSVADNGPGIPSRIRENLRDKASVADSRLSVTGGGLGLRIVKRILELHDSRIELEESTFGTVFSLCLSTNRNILRYHQSERGDIS